MATALSAPNPPVFGSPEVLGPQSAPILEYHHELESAARSYRHSLARIAYYGFRMRMDQGWVALGFEDGPRGEEAYRESLEIPRSSWYKAVRIGQSLHQLTLEDLQRIQPTNLELLIQVSPVLFHDHAWVSEAKTMKPATFAQLVADRNKTVGDDREPLTWYRAKVPFLAKAAIESMLEEFCHRHDLSSPGQALEMIIADKHDQENLLAACHQARQLVGAAVEKLRRKGVKKEDEQQWLELAKEVLDAGYEEAVQAARKKTHRGQKGGGS